MDAIYKTFRGIVKSVDENTGEVDMLIPVSSSSVDRDGEIVEPTAFKKTLPKFMQRPILVSSHDYRDLTSQIGEWTKLKITENGIEGRPKYYVNEGNEQANWGFKLASKGMAAFSIGFIPKEWEDGDGHKSPRRTYKEVELLEISQVIVPSNREAIQSIRSKSVDPIITEICDAVEKEIVTKPEETQNYYRIPTPGESGKHDGHKIRTMDVSKEKGIKGLYCIDDKKIITYMFDKDKWETMEAAKEWMMEHMGKAVKVSQEQIIDEIDYLNRLIQFGVSEATQKALINLVEDMKLKRISGSDIPVKDNPTRKENLPVEPLTNLDIFESLKRIGGK